jgi:hypothetical protein
MKVMVGKTNAEYIEAKLDGSGKLDLSIRTHTSDKKAVLITAKLDTDQLDKLIANLILLKSKALNEEVR